MFMEYGERRSGGSGHEAALRAVQRPSGKPWRVGGGGGAGAGATAGPAPPKVYRVAPRDFRELVQRLTGAGAGTAVTTPPPPPPQAMGARQAVPAPAPGYSVAVHGQRSEVPAAAELFDYSPWFSVPLLSPASTMPAGYDGLHHGNGALL